MKRISILAIMLMFMTLIACGSATFETASVGPGEQQLVDDGEGDGGNNAGDTPTERIPLREIENDPTLLDRYACPTDPTSVEICHYPEGSGNYHTLCIGRSAVD